VALNPRQIEAFRLVMLHGSVTDAAYSLNVSQPAVSRMIKEFEARTGLVLFERRGNLLVPTPEAHQLLAEVERLSLRLEAISTFAADLRHRVRGTLSVVAVPALAMSYLPRFTAKFLKDRKLSRVYLNAMPSHQVVETVIAGQAEIGIAAAPRERPGLRIEPIDARAVLLVPKGHRLAGRRRAKPSDIVDEHLISLSDPTIITPAGSARLANLTYERMITTPLTTIALSLVAAGAGLAIADPFAVANDLAGETVAIPFDPPIGISIAILTSEHRRLSAVSDDFLAGLREEIGQTIAANK
jgi:DNA-binding transcriptional LysR family regulator